MKEIVLLAVFICISAFAVENIPTEDIKSVRIFALRSEDKKEIYLGPWEKSSPLPKIKDLPTNELPAGKYDIFARYSVHSEKSNGVLVSLGGRSLIMPVGLNLKDYIFKCRISESMQFGMRAQEGVTQYSSTWLMYESNINLSRDNHTALVQNNTWKAIDGEKIYKSDLTYRPMHDVEIRCEGNTFTVTIDGKTAVRRDKSNTFPEGSIVFRSDDSGTKRYVDDVKITDLKTGEIIFEDDFNRKEIGDKWNVCSGSYGITNGFIAVVDKQIGNITVDPAKPGKFPVTRIAQSGDSQRLYINGKLTLPQFYRFTTGDKPYNPDSYDTIRRVYNSGVRLFVPIIPGLDLKTLNDVYAQLRLACPEAYFIISTSIPVPSKLPESERIHFCDGSKSLTNPARDSDTKVGSSVSIYSELYRTNDVPLLVEKLINNIQHGGGADKVIGILINGGGYEGGWGQGGTWPRYLLDLSGATMKKYTAFLTEKYGSDEALQKAWGRNDVTLEKPYIPSLAERTVSDIGGFRDPSKKERMYINDFLDFYSIPVPMARTVYECARKLMPDSLITAFGGGAVLNASFGIIQPRIPANAHGRGELSCMVSLLTYGDRGCGGVSINANYGDLSVRRAGHMHLQELDLRSPKEADSGEKDWDSVAQVFRREFAVQVLSRQNAFWYFDMGYTGPWYDHPVPLGEMAKEKSVGDRYFGIERKNITEAALVQDGRHQKYYAMSPVPYEGKEKIPYSTPIYYNENYSTHAPEAAVRMGAPCDGFNMNDFDAFKDNFKLYIFPCAGYMTSSEREKVRALASRGAVCVFMGPAGLVDESSASLENMYKLLGMKINIGPIGEQKTFAIEGSSPLVKGMDSKSRLGASRWFDGLMEAKWHQFYIDDPTVEKLGTYSDGKNAYAAKRCGKGWIIYSAVALTNPTAYRNIAKFAGVHVYLDTIDFTYADSNFVTVHSKEAGVKKIKLPRPATEIKEIFSDEIIARDTDSFDVEMDAGKTKVFYIGK